MTLVLDLITIAQSLMTEFGQSATFTRTTATAYDPTTATRTETTTTYTGDVYVSSFDNREIGSPYGSTVIKADDLKILATDMDLTPQEGDIVTLDSVDYRIMQVSKTNVSGSDVLYKIQARK